MIKHMSKSQMSRSFILDGGEYLTLQEYKSHPMQKDTNYNHHKKKDTNYNIVQLSYR
jgi:hypothetical protein